MFGFTLWWTLALPEVPQNWPVRESNTYLIIEHCLDSVSSNFSSKFGNQNSLKRGKTASKSVRDSPETEMFVFEKLCFVMSFYSRFDTPGVPRVPNRAEKFLERIPKTPPEAIKKGSDVCVCLFGKKSRSKYSQKDPQSS